VDRVDAIDAFDLNDDQPLDQQINAIPEFQFRSLVNQGQTNLCGHMKTSFPQFVGEAGLVRTLQQAGAEQRVDLQRRIDNRAGDAIDVGHLHDRWVGHVQNGLPQRSQRNTEKT
jgi:hypothetical protein